jgi:hypothetical protein
MWSAAFVLNKNFISCSTVELIGGNNQMEGNVYATNLFSTYGPICGGNLFSQETVRIN